MTLQGLSIAEIYRKLFEVCGGQLWDDPMFVVGLILWTRGSFDSLSHLVPSAGAQGVSQWLPYSHPPALARARVRSTLGATASSSSAGTLRCCTSLASPLRRRPWRRSVSPVSGDAPVGQSPSRSRGRSKHRIAAAKSRRDWKTRKRGSAPKVVDVGRSPADFEQTWCKLDRIWAEFGRIRAEVNHIAQTLPGLVRI